MCKAGEEKICIWLRGEEQCVRVWEDECVKKEENVKDVQYVITEGEYVKGLFFLMERMDERFTLPDKEYCIFVYGM